MPIRVYNLLTTLINAGLYIVSFFIGLRIIFRLFSANSSTPLVSWVYNVSDFFMTPFRGIFPNLGTDRGVIDIVAIISLLGYILLGYFIVELFKGLIVTSNATTTHYHDINDEDEEVEVHHH